MTTVFKKSGIILRDLSIIPVDEGSEIQAKGMHKFFKEITSEKFSNLKNKIKVIIQEPYRTLNRQDQKRLLGHSIIKMPNTQNDDRILKSHKRKMASHSCR